jgi:hypothetical protein
VPLREVLDETRQQQMLGGAECAQGGGAAGQRARPPHHVRRLARRRERALGFGPQQPAGVGELQAAAGAHEECDAEFGFEVRDLLGDAGASEAQHLGRGGERAVLDRGEEVRELVQRHVGISYGNCSQSALARGRAEPDTPAHDLG